jgi:hypothetical protein
MPFALDDMPGETATTPAPIREDSAQRAKSRQGVAVRANDQFMNHV